MVNKNNITKENKTIQDDLMTVEEFSFYIKSMRESIGVSQEEFASLIGVNKSTYARYESGKNLPRNWGEISNKISKLAKSKARKRRENGDFASITKELGSKIIEMHLSGKNIVQIGTRLDIDEDKVEKFLKYNDYEPILFKIMY